jgi:hypothetical protein
MEVLSRSSVILDLRLFGGGELACGVDDVRMSGRVELRATDQAKRLEKKDRERELGQKR